MSMYRTNRAALGAILLGLAGCVAPVAGGGEELAAQEQALARFEPVTLFTSHGMEVPVCFLSGLPASKRAVRAAIDTSWATVSQLRFTGWGDCPSPAGARAVTIRINDDTNGASGSAAPGVGARLDGIAQIVLNLPTNHEFLKSVARHEMGHALGLPHEHQRNDGDHCAGGWATACATANDCPATRKICDVTRASGNAAKPWLCADEDHAIDPSYEKLTPYDRKSIMGYCRDDGERRAGELTDWDIFGIQQLYGRRVLEFVPLYTQWSAIREDHATGAWTQPSGVNANGNASYGLAYFEGWIFGYPAPGATTPLDLYFHAGRGDHVLVGRAETRAAVIAAGYTFTATLGYAYPGTGAQPVGTSRLRQFWHDGRKDHYAARVPSQGADTAEELDYEPGLVEAFVLTSLPYKILWQHYHAVRGDNFVTPADGPHADGALRDGYVRAGMAGMALTLKLTGSVTLNQLFSIDRVDFFATTSTAAFAGYVPAGNEGLVFSARSGGMVPVQLWWHAGRRDNFTASENTHWASGSNYVRGADQGFVFPLQGRL